MAPTCLFPSDTLAQQFCEDLVNPANGFGLSPNDLDRGVDETRLSKVQGGYRPAPQTIGQRDGLLSATEVYQKIIEVAENRPAPSQFLKGRLEIPWTIDPQNFRTPDEGPLRNWALSQIRLIKNDLAREGRREGDFSFDVELSRRLFVRLTLPPSQGGLGLTFDPILKNSPRSLGEIFTQRHANCLDFTVLFLMIADLAGLPLVPINLYKEGSGKAIDHLRIGLKNPRTGIVEKIADIQVAYFGDSKSGEIWAPVSRRELLSFYYNAKAVKESDPQKAEAHTDFALRLGPRNYLALFNKGFYRLLKMISEAPSSFS